MRVDSSSRRIAALREEVFRAFVEPGLLAVWLPPEGMNGHLEHIDARAGGGFRMVLTHESEEDRGKFSENSDVADTRIVALEPPERVVWSVEFPSEDPAFAGTMSMEWTLKPAPEATDVTVRATDVPSGIDAADHVAGMSSSLEKLAGLFENHSPASHLPAGA